MWGFSGIWNVTEVAGDFVSERVVGNGVEEEGN